MVKSHPPALSLVTGGAASGKSAFAENLCLSMSCGGHYVATMRRSAEPETCDKISRHQLARGAEWTTSEVPLRVAEHVAGLAGGAALVDCATLWLANALEAGEAGDGAALAASLEAATVPVVVVTNELGLGLVPMDAGARAFRDAHGRMNQALAARAGLVVLVTAGIPMAIKGRLP